MIDYLELIPTPKAGSINSGLKPCPTSYIINKFGAPGKRKTVNCANHIQSDYWKKRTRTINIGPCKATGFKPFLLRLELAMKEVKITHPHLYKLIGSAGCLCVRKVRGGSNWSNHSLGMAIDFTLGGKLDTFGDNKTQRGLLVLYSILKKYDIYWLAENSTEDSMHFEASDKLVKYWEDNGYLVK